MLRAGLIGLPSTGKTTIFQLLTRGTRMQPRVSLESLVERMPRSASPPFPMPGSIGSTAASLRSSTGTARRVGTSCMSRTWRMD